MSRPAVPFRTEMQFAYGEAAALTPLIRRVVCENPGPFTLHGTNSYIVGRGEVAVIDPGPDHEPHIAALARALDGETVTHILATHTHRDHSPAAAALQRRVGGRILGGVPKALPPGEPPQESHDDAFAPDELLRDGAAIAGQGWTLTALFTPGHMSNHYCFALDEERALFSGDHVMGWNTTIVSPPDGDMGDYLASLRRCLARDDALYWPGHGPEITAPRPYVRACLSHRLMRETEIRRCLEDGADTVPAMVARMYRHLPERMHRAAARSVLAHLLHMENDGRVEIDGAPGMEARYRLR